MSFRGLRPNTKFVPFLFSALIAGLGTWGSITGCSAGAESNGHPEAEPSGSGGAGSGMGTAGGPSASSSSSGGSLDLDGGLGEGSIGGEACASTSAEAEPVPLDMILLLDRSGSMMGTSWTGATSAVKQFVNDPASAGMNVGLLYFPIDSPPDGKPCTHTHYDDLVVPIGALPQHAPLIVASIDGESPKGGSTPMFGALKGALFAATAHKDAMPDHEVIVVLASDGDPNGCLMDQNSIGTIADLAANALSYNGVKTYVIAIQGATVQNLNQIASAGGTGQAYDVTSNINQFAQKMSEIRKAAVACEYVIPSPPGNQVIEFDQVAVEFTPGPGGPEEEIPRADGKADCGSGPGWYYDDPIHPKKIVLCPGSCSIVQGAPEGKVDVLFGCEPELN